MEKLTIKEAFKRGYTKYGFSGLEWQNIHDISDLNLNVDAEDLKDLVLFEKASTNFVMESENIAEIVSEAIADKENEESGRDNNEVYEAIKKIDYTDITKKINIELKKHSYWKLTEIMLVK